MYPSPLALNIPIPFTSPSSTPFVPMPLSPLSQLPSANIALGKDKENQEAPRKIAPAPRRRRTRPARGSLAASVSNPIVAADSAAQRAVRRESPSSPTGNIIITPSVEPTAPASVSKPVMSYKFPRSLPRPPIPRVTDAAIAAVDKNLLGIPIEYLRHKLKNMHKTLEQGLAAVTATPVPPNCRSLPEELTLLVAGDQKSRLPTHIIVAMDLDGKSGTMFPFHDIVLVTHCAHLPPLPQRPNPTPEVKANSSTVISLPVVAVRLPKPELFKSIFNYLYSKNSSNLLSMLIPLPPSAIPSRDSASATPVEDFNLKVSRALADTFTPVMLVEQLRIIHGLWSNVVMLGIEDPGLWHAMQYAWDVLIGAGEIATTTSQG